MISIALFASTLAVAHDLYILPGMFHLTSTGLIRLALHNGDSFPESEVAPKPERLKSAQLLGKGLESSLRNLRIVGKETVAEVNVPLPGEYLLAVATVPNFIELSPEKFAEYLKEEGLTNVIEWRNLNGENAKPGRERYTKFAKSLVILGTPDGFYNQPLHWPIEIIPLADPYTLHAGGRLPVRVLFHEKPAEGLQVEWAWASSVGEGPAGKQVMVAGRTGADGILEIPLARAGRYRLHSLKMERCKEPGAADWESSWASLTFEIL